MSSLERERKLTWFTEPKQPVPGHKVKLLYNAQSGSLAYMTPLPSPPTLVLGYNGWIDTQVGTLYYAWLSLPMWHALATSNKVCWLLWWGILRQKAL